MKQGDFTDLADDYSKFRPSYNKDVLGIILKSTGKNPKAINAADIGAGTGIFTKQLIKAGVSSVTAVEPNEKMREAGIKFLGEDVRFLDGSAEKTGLKSSSIDLVSMASSFHWAKTSDALREFDRILYPNGVFSALWNPRLTDRSPIESKVEELLKEKYQLKSRISSGLGGITQELHQLLRDCGIFRSVEYADAVDVVRRSAVEYIGAWRSVNDVQAQLGKYAFERFIEDVERIVSEYSYVEVHYLTRVWIAQK